MRQPQRQLRRTAAAAAVAAEAAKAEEVAAAAAAMAEEANATAAADPEDDGMAEMAAAVAVYTEAAVRVQRVVRGKSARVMVKSMPPPGVKPLDENAAAIRLQRIHRGNSTRKEMIGKPATPPPDVSAQMGDAPGEWIYLDEEGLEQGPFSERMLLDWYIDGYLPDDLRMRHISKRLKIYSPLSELVAEGGRLHPQLNDMLAGAQWQAE